MEDLWLRSHPAEEPDRVTTLIAVRGLGLRGDCHADRLSPRQVLLVSAQTYRRLRIPDASLRENIRLSADVSTFESGSLLAIGNSARLWLMFPCEACGRMNRHSSGLLKTVGRDRGILARVISGGVIRTGDRVHVRRDVLPSWPTPWQERLRYVVSTVPSGHVVEYGQLARLVGVPLNYCRAFPRVLAAVSRVPSERAVSSGVRSGVRRWMGDGVFAAERRV